MSERFLYFGETNEKYMKLAKTQQEVGDAELLDNILYNLLWYFG